MSSFLKILLFALPIFLQAKDLGSHGHTYPVLEESLLEVILMRASKLSQEQVSCLQEKIRKRYGDLLEEPRPVKELSESLSEKISYVDPSHLCREDILDQKGKRIVAKGTLVNPLEHFTPKKRLLFIDGSKPSHVKWAEKQGEQALWVLVKGRPLDLEKEVGRPVYFDQFGQAVEKFRIEHIPASVSAEGLRLKIRVAPLHEVGA